MRVAVLTTQTSHHAHFVRSLAETHDVVGVLCETEAVKPRIHTEHPFEAERDAFETEQWFGGSVPDISAFAPCHRHASLNSDAAVRDLKGLSPDAAIVFGTGRLSEAVIDLLPGRLVNLHGGNPEEYRGLDTHLWAVYHGDFGSLQTCVHYVVPRLDTGRVLNIEPIPLHRGMELHELRKANTEVCVGLARHIMDFFGEGGVQVVRPMNRIGRYYSFMPTCLKELCVEKFRRHTETLP